MERNSFQVIQRKQYREIHIQLIPEPGETAQGFAEKIAQILNDDNAKVVRATFFGPLTELDPIMKYLDNKLSGIDFPLTWIEGGLCTDAFINGVYIHAISGIEIKRLYQSDNIVGSFFQTSETDFCFLGGLYSDPDLPLVKQTENIFVSSNQILNQAGLRYDNTIRTWFYLDDILGWYNEFNRTRTAFYLQHDIFNKLVPASTGIGGKNPAGSGVCLELTAIKPKNDLFAIGQVQSPLQCSAQNYGSAFSRAVRYSDSEYTGMTVSGTASINSEGKTMHVNDLWKQFERSFAVVKAILDSQHFSFSDAVRAYAYCSDKKYSKEFYQYIKTCLPEQFAFLCAENKICRDELMFEIEVDVIKEDKK